MNEKVTLICDKLKLYFNENRIQFSYFDSSYVPESLLIADNIKIEPYCAFLGSNLLHSMGSFSYSHARLPMDTVVGRFCSIAASVSIMGVNHPIERFTTSSLTYDPHFDIYNRFFIDRGLSFTTAYSDANDNDHGHVTIGHDVWIGESALLSRGISIGTGAVVGARAVVTKDVPPYAIVVGVPARIIKFRFDEMTIERLLQSEWWNRDFSFLSTVNADTCIDNFIATASRAPMLKDMNMIEGKDLLLLNQIYDEINELKSKNVCLMEEISTLKKEISTQYSDRAKNIELSRCRLFELMPWITNSEDVFIWLKTSKLMKFRRAVLRIKRLIANRFSSI